MAENTISKLSINDQSYNLAGGAIVLDPQTATFQDVIDAAKNGPVYFGQIAEEGSSGGASGGIYMPIFEAVGVSDGGIVIAQQVTNANGGEVDFILCSGALDSLISASTPIPISLFGDFNLYPDVEDEEIKHIEDVINNTGNDYGGSILTQTDIRSYRVWGGGIGIINVRKDSGSNIYKCSAVTGDGFSYYETEYGTNPTRMVLGTTNPPYNYEFKILFDYSGLYVADNIKKLEDPSTDKHFIFKGYADKTYALKSEISTLQETITNLQSTITQLQSTITELQSKTLTDLDRNTLDVIEGGTT